MEQDEWPFVVVPFVALPLMLLGMDFRRAAAVAFMLLAAALALGAGFDLYRRHRRRNRLLSDGRQAIGTVVDFDDGTEESLSPHSFVEFQPLSGPAVWITVRGRLPVNSTVQVIYDPTDPEGAMAAAERGSWLWIVRVAVLLVTGLSLWFYSGRLKG